MFFLFKCGILVLLMGIFLPALGDESETVCKNVTKKFYVSLDKGNFHQAFLNCKEGGMELASIENEYESAALDAFLDPYKQDGFNNSFWLSGTNLNDQTIFQYHWLSTGSRAIFTNWLPGEPNNGGGLEHCMHWTSSEASYNTTVPGWNDWNCNNTIKYVCEYIP